MKENIVKIIGIFFVVLIVLALVLFVMGKINAYWFWLVVILSAVVAYKVLPKLRDK